MLEMRPGTGEQEYAQQGDRYPGPASTRWRGRSKFFRHVGFGHGRCRKWSGVLGRSSRIPDRSDSMLRFVRDNPVDAAGLVRVIALVGRIEFVRFVAVTSVLVDVDCCRTVGGG